MEREDGFTLVELLIVTIIMGLIVSSITAAIIVGLRTTDQTQQRLRLSHDRQMAAAFFATDVQSSDSVSISDTTCSGVEPVVRFRWTDQGVVKISSYAVVVTTEAERQLRRFYCEDSVLVNTTTVAHTMAPAPGPTLTCTPACPGTSTPSKVSLAVTDTDGVTFTVLGSRRVR